ncbi:MAG: argininosuccinate synthase [Bacteroidota bacterium]
MSNSSSKKIVLAYSGGLDTSFCIPYLTREKGYEVYALTVNTGGFNKRALGLLEAQAYRLGAHSFKYVDIEKKYYQQCLRYLLFGNILRNNTYPLSVSAERMFQALEVIQYAKAIGAEAVAHGSTGAGNDQVRFDLIFKILAPEINIITPIRDQKLSRQAEVQYLQQWGFQWKKEKAQYSINQGLWGTSVGGAETLTSHQTLPESAFPSQLSQQAPQAIQLTFEKGEPIALNDEAHPPIQIIKKVNQLASSYAIGRDVHVGDTIIGIKGRVGFEAAAPLILIKAHHLLEKHVLGKWQQYWKEQLANWYGMLLHEGQYLDPVMRNIEQFMESTQERVSGTVFIKLHPYRFELQGIQSPYDLMQSSFGQYGEMNNAWTGEDVKGFTQILANTGKLWQAAGTPAESLSSNALAL